MKLPLYTHNGNRSHVVGLLVLLVLLFSAVSHSHEVSLDTAYSEQVDCKLCHSKTEPKLSHLEPLIVSISVYLVPHLFDRSPQTTSCQQEHPGQRAPPAN